MNYKFDTTNEKREYDMQYSRYELQYAEYPIGTRLKLNFRNMEFCGSVVYYNKDTGIFIVAPDKDNPYGLHNNLPMINSNVVEVLKDNFFNNSLFEI